MLSTNKQFQSLVANYSYSWSFYLRSIKCNHNANCDLCTVSNFSHGARSQPARVVFFAIFMKLCLHKILFVIAGVSQCGTNNEENINI